MERGLPRGELRWDVAVPSKRKCARAERDLRGRTAEGGAAKHAEARRGYERASASDREAENGIKHPHAALLMRVFEDAYPNAPEPNFGTAHYRVLEELDGTLLYTCSPYLRFFSLVPLIGGGSSILRPIARHLTCFSSPFPLFLRLFPFSTPSTPVLSGCFSCLRLRLLPRPPLCPSPRRSAIGPFARSLPASSPPS